MYEAADATSEIIRKNPDTTGARFAANAALDLLAMARERLDNRDYVEAFRGSKDAIRMASSALLLNDGYVASTFEATLRCIEERHSGQLPIDEWQYLENMLTGEGPGLLNLIVRLAGKNMKTGKHEASQAIAIAERFVASVMAIIELRS